MRSTFMGLETSKRGLYTQQSALYTTGHNISNANTIGYTRQRVNLEATQGYPGYGLNTMKTAGHIGTGVQAHSVQRMRDEFIDRQYRQEVNNLGYWQSTTKSISQMEDIMSEPSEFGLNQSFTEFWKSMEDVIDNPKDLAARQVMLSKGQGLVESFNYMDKQLKLVQGNIGSEISVDTKTVNSLLKQIADLNHQIEKVEPNGHMPNDLYDARDVLLDKLNELIPVSVSYEKTGGNALDIAEGSMTIKYNPANGPAITLVESKEYAHFNPMDSQNNIITGDVNPITGEYDEFQGFAISDLGRPPAESTAINVVYNDLEQSKGKLAALVDAYGHSNGQGLYPEMIANLDELARVFVEEFNNIHRNGFGLDDSTGLDFFTGTTAKDITIVITDPKQIGVSDAIGEEGNNKNMLELSKLQSTVQVGLQGGTFQSYYKSLVGDLGVKGEQAVRFEFNSGTLQLQIANNRASHNSVSLDEEMTNMITFQQAYNANARMVTVVDETLDKIINGMGRVGL